MTLLKREIKSNIENIKDGDDIMFISQNVTNIVSMRDGDTSLWIGENLGIMQETGIKNEEILESIWSDRPYSVYWG